jgi:hypothetical protein
VLDLLHHFCGNKIFKEFSIPRCWKSHQVSSPWHSSPGSYDVGDVHSQQYSHFLLLFYKHAYGDLSGELTVVGIMSDSSLCRKTWPIFASVIGHALSGRILQ